eukprot:13573784-Alexandrium_andersonii.AAC.1
MASIMRQEFAKLRSEPNASKSSATVAVEAAAKNARARQEVEKELGRVTLDNEERKKWEAI